MYLINLFCVYSENVCKRIYKIIQNCFKACYAAYANRTYYRKTHFTKSVAKAYIFPFAYLCLFKNESPVFQYIVRHQTTSDLNLIRKEVKVKDVLQMHNGCGLGLGKHANNGAVSSSILYRKQ